MQQQIHITEAAAHEVRRLMQEEHIEGAYLRVAVQGGGCSGLSYRMRFEREAGPKDRVIDDPSGLRVLVDPKSFLFLSGIELDFQRGLNYYGFRFSNPQASRTCGCGSSFSA